MCWKLNVYVDQEADAVRVPAKKKKMMDPVVGMVDM